MSTRATYTIEDRHFYIHYDGYPEGAAIYFRDMIQFENRRGGNVCRFLRANDLAEFTGRPDLHGDTEFHYTLDKEEYLVAHKITHKHSKSCFYAGSLAGFLNQYLKDGDDGFPKDEYLTYKGRTTSKRKLAEQYQEEMEKNLRWLAGGHIGQVSLRELLPMFYALNGIKELPKDIIFLADHCREAYDHHGTTLAYIERVYSEFYQVAVNQN